MKLSVQQTNLLELLRREGCLQLPVGDPAAVRGWRATVRSLIRKGLAHWAGGGMAIIPTRPVSRVQYVIRPCDEGNGRKTWDVVRVTRIGRVVQEACVATCRTRDLAYATRAERLAERGSVKP